MITIAAALRDWLWPPDDCICPWCHKRVLIAQALAHFDSHRGEQLWKSRLTKPTDR